MRAGFSAHRPVPEPYVVNPAFILFRDPSFTTLRDRRHLQGGPLI
ncbi:hypothetical protein A6302_00955 [Methylobrevis pamukkalensis]|uniref:Uncharacterized protein n=1 Tax=Methylobrevis pamukkalensis TaxID=1439726 RepID=A0A1E3H889_9HYPH|nr:hypothetical protein A6302_00955 [Methylobrevis pamukkalensis]